jgi:tetratricopeptide (TPR) repeat protein
MNLLKEKKKIAFIALSLILIITALIYLPVKDYEFLYFDDDTYVTENKSITDLSPHGIVQILFGKENDDNPRLTILSFAIDYAIDGHNPRVYHLHNLLLYLLGICVLFFFIRKLFKRYDFAVLLVLLFAVLSTHVESVVWISQRKDMLYFLFYFLSLLFYLKYIEDKKNAIVWIVLSFLFFFMSFHSKVAALSLLPTLFLVDYLRKRQITWKLLLEKTPFVLLFFYFILMFSIDNASNENTAAASQMISSSVFYTFKDKIFLASFSLLYYLKMFFYPHPIYLIHPYPEKENGLFPLEYYYSFFVVLLLISALIILFVKLKTRNKRELLFGLLFFLINIGLYLHFVSIKGIVIVADRYSLVAYVGLLIMLCSIILTLFSSLKSIKKGIALSFFILVYTGLFIQHSFVTARYIPKWKNNELIFTDIITKNPNVFQAYNNRGIYYLNNKEYFKAINDFTKAIEINPLIAYLYNNRGYAFMETEQYSKALSDFQKSLSMNPNDYKVQHNLSKCHIFMKNFHDGLKAYDELIKDNPEKAEVWNDRGKLKNELGMYQEAIFDFNQALLLNAKLISAYNNRGIAYANIQDYDKAMDDFNTAISIDNNCAESYMNKGNLLSLTKKHTAAIQNYNLAIAINGENAYAYMNRAACYYEIMDIDMACKDWERAESLGMQEAGNLLKEYCK